MLLDRALPFPAFSVSNEEVYLFVMTKRGIHMLPNGRVMCLMFRTNFGSHFISSSFQVWNRLVNIL